MTIALAVRAILWLPNHIYPPMNRLIVLSPFDCKFYNNTRTHHVVGQLRRRFDEVVLLYKHTNTPTTASRWRRLANFFLLRSEIEHDGNLISVAVRPPFARSDGMSLVIMGVVDPYQAVTGPRSVLIKLLGLGGLVLDLFLIPAYVIAYLRRAFPRADVVIAQGPEEFLAARLLVMLGRVSLLVYDDLDYVPGSYPLSAVSALKHRAIKALENYCIRRADVVISIGELLARLRHRELGRDPLVIPNGADISLFAQARNKRPHPPTLIYVGTVCTWAGVDLTIAALGRIRNEIPGARLLVVGHTTPEYRKLLNALSEEHGVREHVQFVGNKTPLEVVDLLTQADIGMAAFRPVELRRYAFSLKIIEYMAAGLPVITTVDTQSELVVVKHDAGLAVDYSANAIAEAALLLFKDPARYRAMSARGIEASAAYSWDTLILKELYPALARHGGGAAGPAHA